MISAIVNGFNSVIDFLSTIVEFLGRIIKAGAKLISSIPDIIETLSAAIGILPTLLLSAALFCITVRAAVLIINHKAGE